MSLTLYKYTVISALVWGSESDWQDREGQSEETCGQL